MTAPIPVLETLAEALDEWDRLDADVTNTGGVCADGTDLAEAARAVVAQYRDEQRRVLERMHTLEREAVMMSAQRLRVMPSPVGGQAAQDRTTARLDTTRYPATCAEAGNWCRGRCTQDSGRIVDPDCFRGTLGQEMLADWRRATDPATCPPTPDMREVSCWYCGASVKVETTAVFMTCGGCGNNTYLGSPSKLRYGSAT